MSNDEIVGRIMVVIVLLGAAGEVALGASWAFFVGWALVFGLISVFRYAWMRKP